MQELEHATHDMHDTHVSVWIAGRNRKSGEMNGKSGNMNNVLAQIYPTGCFVPNDELIAVFDADQARGPSHSRVALIQGGTCHSRVAHATPGWLCSRR